MELSVRIDPAVVDLTVGLVEGVGVTVAPADAALIQQCQAWVGQVRQSGPEGGDQRRQAVRQLLRAGGFKPSGRNKPAQEYLLRTAGEAGQWPVILNAVDVLNAISLRSGLPISLLACQRAGTTLVIRYGQPGEKFVFNQAGQELDLEGLITVCRGDPHQSIPVGTPVKDSQLAKVVPGDRHVVACIFAPRSAVPADVLSGWSQELAQGLRQWCAAEHVSTCVL